MKNSVLFWMTFIGVGLAAWQAVLHWGIVSPAVLASPREVMASLPSVLSPSGNLPDILSTIKYSLAAFLISVPSGVTLGMIAFFGGGFAAPVRFLLDFLRSVPATALVPVFLIVVGVNDTTKMMVGSFSSSLVIAIAATAGLAGRNATRVAVARLLGMTGPRRVLAVDLPEAAPQLFLGMRAGISLALVLVVVSEMMIGANRGLGKVISDMRFTDDKGRMYAAIIVAGSIGYVYNVALSAIERLVLHWHYSSPTRPLKPRATDHVS